MYSISLYHSQKIKKPLAKQFRRLSLTKKLPCLIYIIFKKITSIERLGFTQLAITPLTVDIVHDDF